MSNSQTEWWAPVEGNGQSADLFGGDPTSAQPPRRSRSGGRAREARQRKQRRNRGFLVVLVALLLVVGAGYVVVQLLGGMFDDKGGSSAEKLTDYPGPGFGSATVTINPGDTGADMGAALADAGVVASAQAFNAAFAANTGAASIQPGTYSLLQEMKASDAVDALLNPASKSSFRVTIPEGLTKDQIVARINEKTLIPTKELNAALKDSKAIGLPSQADGNAEGWLFPATYDVQPDASAADVLKMMTAKTVSVLNDKKVAKDDWETVLNKASLVEREGKLDEDRPKMARVIENRLDQGWTLGIDAAVAYGAGINGTQLTDKQLKDTSNPYNTRVHAGLPPTPIASPGEASIDAVLKPADGDWMYWCTVNPETGETVFSETGAEHDVAVAQLNKWIDEHGNG
ncbi:endolytic transglycosylase MltG [Cellulomonas rhizosphaerae]|uniref:Endolytic murein transglycosylase n=1 Tax=Cellulomonas rhizosphaerae TaxID=2293719 RepID=A0A413RL97_9CELL|nr:endolytic transglycosylase MltG [Cellulomonas rhizosphaerae]RHA40527.1 endolytic transglycosylase MltG [Cellulomonas rhizosphaerae]